jgi:bifunctional UDP-N-acetylglucosamine pyrophosphorylase/glucosamine-1-phosphate N-acetyltransferase
MTNLSLILAAGLGKRMHSKLPKVQHPIAGRPMIDYALRTESEVTGTTPVVIVGLGGEAV